MKILKIIHGFPPFYMAGSEIYSYHLVKELERQNINVFLFTRFENQFTESYTTYEENFENIKIFRINKPSRDYQFDDKFFDKKIDNTFENYLDKNKFDLVHIGHLSHLSTNLINIIKNYRLPIVYTIHDFWLFCVKGQMINAESKICRGQSPKKCRKCSPYKPTLKEVKNTLAYMQQTIAKIDLFISPSLTLKKFFIKNGIAENKIKFLKYGFQTNKITFLKKSFKKNDRIKFGFIGRIIPNKGIKLLIDTFNKLENISLEIYGSIDKNEKEFLERKNICFMDNYHNDDIDNILKKIDVLIVPSLWYENSPLVIQEAFLAGVPVITSDLGGMKELVKNNVNGYTFEVGNMNSLTEVIKRIIEDPSVLNGLQDSRGEVMGIEEHVGEVIKIYESLLS